jgi:hypothetical protein
LPIIQVWTKLLNIGFILAHPYPPKLNVLKTPNVDNFFLFNQLGASFPDSGSKETRFGSLFGNFG